MERKFKKVLNYNIDTFTFSQSIEYILKKIENNEGMQIVTINPEMIELANNHKEFADILDNADLVVADGVGIKIALKLKGINIEQVRGIELAKSIGVNRIIFHPGGGHNNTEEGRIVAVKQLIDAVNEFTSEVDMGDVRLYPEIGGKTANLGSLDEIIEICKNCEYCYPCIDIAHLHARENGSIISKDILREKLQKVKDELPDKFKYIHFHAYTINYNDKGEIKHLMHGEDMPNGSEGRPNLQEFVELLHEMEIEPWVISEASDTQEIGAKYMRDLYN